MLSLCACSKGVAKTSSAWPAKLRYLVSISDENPDVESSRLAPIGRYLESELHIPVEVMGTSGYGVAIEALRAHKIEACTLGSFGYVIAADKAGAEVIAMRGSMEGKPSVYTGSLAVVADSTLKTVDDLIAHAKELTVSFVDPASSSGNLVQRGFLHSVGIVPEKAFKKVVYSQNHPAGAMTLLAGKVDVAAVSTTLIPSLVRTHKLKEGAIRYLWMSPGIPEGPIAVRKDLPQDFKDKLRDALVQMQAKAPEAYLNMTAKVYYERYQNTKFVPANDAIFNPLRVLAKGLDLTQVTE